MSDGSELARRATSTAVGFGVLGIGIGWLRNSTLLMGLFACMAGASAVLRALPPVRRGQS